MRPSLAPWGELPTTPVRTCTHLSDGTPSDIAPVEAEIANDNRNCPESPPTSILQSQWSKDVTKFCEKIRQKPVTPEGIPEDGHAPKLTMLDMQLTRTSSLTTSHGRPQFTVLLKSMKMWPTRMPYESSQHMLTDSATQLVATKGESIAPRHEFDIAYVEGTIDRIEYGLFRSCPAAFVCIDMILKYHPTNIIRATE